MQKNILTFFIFLVHITLFAQFPERFESAIFPPSGWQIFDNGKGTQQSWRTSDKAFMGTNAAFIRYEDVPDVLAEDWLVTPRFTPTQQSHILSFFEKDNYANDYATIYTIRVSTATATNPSDFTIIDQQTESQLGLSYKYHEVDLSDYIGKQIYLAFVMTNDDGDDWLIDEIHLSQCSKPENIHNLDTFSDGAIITWEDNNAGLWDIEIVESDKIPTGTPDYKGIQKPFQWKEGKPSTQYSVYLRSHCTGNNVFSNWSEPFSFFTQCKNESCEYKFVLSDSYGDDWNGAYIEVKQKGISLGKITQDEKGFGPYEFFISFCDSSEFELIWNAGSWDSECIFSLRDIYDQEYYSFTAGNFPADEKVFYKGIADCRPLTCRFPTNLFASEFSETGAKLTWQEKDNATLWDIEFVPIDEQQKGIPDIQNIDTNPFIWKYGLPGQYYKAYVRSVCQDNQYSKWSLPVVFTTRCPEAIDEYPYRENFSTEYLLPRCWISETRNSSLHNWQSAKDTYFPDTVVVCKNANENQDVWLNSPPFNFSGINSKIELTFDWKTSYYWMVYPYEKADIKVRLSTDKGKTWSNPIWTENDAGFFESFEWQNTKIDISYLAGAENVWVAFQYKGKDAATVYLNNFSIEIGSGDVTAVSQIEKDMFDIYPNPFTDNVKVSYIGKKSKSGILKITDLQGKIISVQNIEISAGVNTFNLFTDNLVKGIYIVSLESSSGIITKKLVHL